MLLLLLLSVSRKRFLLSDLLELNAHLFSPSTVADLLHLTPTRMPDKSSLRRQGSSSSSSGVAGELPLRGIHINISSDPFQHRIPPYLQRAWQESRLRRYLSTARQRLLIYFAERSLFSPSSKLHIVAFAFLFCSACFILLLHVGFFSGKKYQDWQFEHYGWWQELEQQEVDLLHKLYPDQGRGQVTAVLLFDPKQEQWQVGAEASESLVPLIEQLCPYDMFASILVWNNNPKINLTVQVKDVQQLLNDVDSCNT